MLEGGNELLTDDEPAVVGGDVRDLVKVLFETSLNLSNPYRDGY